MSKNMLFCYLLFAGATLAAIRPQASKSAKGTLIQINDNRQAVFTSLTPDGSLLLIQPAETTAVVYANWQKTNDQITFYNSTHSNLVISETWRNLTPDLLERVIRVTARHYDQRYYLDMGWRTPAQGDYYSFIAREDTLQNYSPSCSGPEFGQAGRQTLPFLGYVMGDTLYGLIGDSPALWENRLFMTFDPPHRRLSLCNGDGSSRRTIMIPRSLDATTVYRGLFDGWQHIEVGETQTWKSWIFSSPVRNRYDVQLASHLALANAKGFTGSAIEAILRNTSYMLLRRNFLRPESDYLFISGIGYGWKQWVTDGFYMSRGLDDPLVDRAAHAAVFFERINYEDNAQCYLIWSVLVKRSGGDPDMRTVGRAYRFMREHEQDGLYIPPRLNPNSKAFKTYHDQLPYDDDDAPSSNQGFHCGALMAARELGFDIADADIEKAIAGYRRMFNESGGYMATSLKQQQHIGQDALYGEVLTFCVFGKKLLPDEMVRRHLETTMAIQSPYGMRVISKANGDLLDGHSGVYTDGGSWFLNDAANYLDGLIHGMNEKWVDNQLVWRLQKELAFMPAFHESISTLTGKPHGHHLYSWNSGYWWHRREVRKRLGLTGPDSVEIKMDQALGVKHRDGYLYLDPKERPFWRTE